MFTSVGNNTSNFIIMKIRFLKPSSITLICANKSSMFYLVQWKLSKPCMTKMLVSLGYQILYTYKNSLTCVKQSLSFDIEVPILSCLHKGRFYIKYNL